MDKIIEVKFGSHLYGTDTPTSDLDIKGVFMPTAREIILGRVPRNISKGRNKADGEKNLSTDVDMEFWSLGEFVKLLSEGQTGALDLLFAPPSAVLGRWQFFDGDIMQHILNNRYQFLSKNVLSFIGYARTQAAKYGIKGSRIASVRKALEFFSEVRVEKRLVTRLSDIHDTIDEFVTESPDEFIKWTPVDFKGTIIPHLEIVGRKFPLGVNVKYIISVLEKIFAEYGERARMAEKNEGVDWKALSHAVRVNNEGIELLLNGTITFPRPEAAILKAIKAGEYKYDEVARMIEGGLVALEDAQRMSPLADKPNQMWIDDFLYSMYRMRLRETM